MPALLSQEVYFCLPGEFSQLLSVERPLFKLYALKLVNLRCRLLIDGPYLALPPAHNQQL